MAVKKVRKDVSDQVDNRYRVRLYNPAGGYYKKIIHGKRLAERHEAAMRDKLATGGVASASDRSITVRPYMNEILAQRRISAATRRNYQGLLTNHICPAIGDRKVSSLATEYRLLMTMFETVGAEAGPAARLAVEGLVRPMLRIAVREAKLPRNPLDGVPWPKRVLVKGAVFVPELVEVVAIRDEIGRQHRGVRPGSIEMTQALLDVMIGAGPRPGEAVAISVADVDYERSTVSINREISYLSGVGLHFAAPKTAGASIRVVPVPQFVLAALAATKLRNGTRTITLPWADKDDRKVGESQTHELFFFSLRDDMPRALAPLLITNRLHRIGERLGLAGDLHGHCYRHRYTTTLDDAGIPQAVIDYVTGHERVGSVTFRVYTKATQAGLDRARKAIDTAWHEALQAAAAKRVAG